MITRSTFLKTLLAAPAAAFALTKAAQPVPPEGPTLILKPTVAPTQSWLVKGLAIKVPSNRVVHRPGLSTTDGTPLLPPEYRYDGDWDGTFKLEAGCSNPAYVMADLYERTGERPDWVARVRPTPSFVGLGFLDVQELLTVEALLNWQMLYDWGRWCDEMDTTWTRVGLCVDDDPPAEWEGAAPRLSVRLSERSAEQLVELREHLRMHCLSWQSTDPRYRTSWPGIPYPEGGV